MSGLQSWPTGQTWSRMSRLLYTVFLILSLWICLWIQSLSLSPSRVL